MDPRQVIRYTCCVQYPLLHLDISLVYLACRQRAITFYFQNMLLFLAYQAPLDAAARGTQVAQVYHIQGNSRVPRANQLQCVQFALEHAPAIEVHSPLIEAFGDGQCYKSRQGGLHIHSLHRVNPLFD